MRSDRISQVHVEVFVQSCEKEFVACVKHDQVDDWLFYNSQSGETGHSPRRVRCSLPVRQPGWA